MKLNEKNLLTYGDIDFSVKIFIIMTNF